VRAVALLAAIGALLTACGGESKRVVRAERVLTGRVDEAVPTRDPTWPDAETSFCGTRIGFGRSQPAGGRSTIFATGDGGRTWSRRARLDLGAATLTCLSRREAVLSAYPPLNAKRAEPLLLRSRDGGAHWARLTVPADASSPPTVLDRDTLVAAQSVTSWYVTSDRARTWRLVAPSAEEPLEALAFLPGGIAYAITSRGDPETARTYLWRSDDGGRSWSRVEGRPDRLRMHGLSAAEGTLWVHAQRCMTASRCRPALLRTHDDGRNWDLIQLSELPPELRFTTKTNGVAAGPGGFYVTSDGGLTWEWRAPG
jgi:photosystem II stability/assembly factor-like uncharacterized protein